MVNITAGYIPKPANISAVVQHPAAKKSAVVQHPAAKKSGCAIQEEALKMVKIVNPFGFTKKFASRVQYRKPQIRKFLKGYDKVLITETQDGYGKEYGVYFASKKLRTGGTKWKSGYLKVSRPFGHFNDEIKIVEGN